MNLTFSPFRAAGIVAVALAAPRDALPRHARIVTREVAREVRRLALDPRHVAGEPSRADGDAARLDALIVLAESGTDPDFHECGGA